MSASEKLKALDAEIEAARGFASAWGEKEDLADALPQILSVVEAAEKMYVYFRGNGYIEREMRDALAALDEVLP